MSELIDNLWIPFQERFVHIRYFAVLDEAGQHQGTLEVTQDLTRLRALDGERRLLQYDDPKEAGSHRTEGGASPPSSE